MANQEEAILEKAGYKQELKRDLDLWSLLLYGVAMMVPVAPIAIYGVVTSVSFGHMALAYLIAVIPMSFTAFSYGQMAGAFPIAGSAYSYTQRAINPYFGFFAGWTIFLDYALFPIFNYIIVAIFTTMLFPSIPYWLVIVVSVLIVTIVNSLGIKSVSRVNNFLVIFMFIVVAYFVIAAIIALAHGTGTGFSTLALYNPETFNMSALLIGTSIACFSFLGFDAMTTLAEEVKNPAKNLSKATVIVCFFMGALFILQAYLAQSVAPDFTQFASPDSAFYEICLQVGGQFLGTLTSIAMIAAGLANAIDAQAGVARVLYSMGRDRVIPYKVFAYLHPKTKVPIYTFIILAVIAFIGTTQSLDTILTIINFGALFAFMCVNLSVVVHFFIKGKKRAGMDFVKYLVLPALGFATCLVLFISLSSNAMIVGGIWLAVGLIYIAISTKFFRVKPKSLDI